ncbi:MAG: ferritin-like domain-containing protein [Ferruginibacter sp.]|nr:ferritin-like domain-containing protein [Chitinophagaceae bacterium]
MKNATKSTANGTSKKKKTNSENASTITHEQLHELFVDGLKDIYWAEKALTKALPKMIKNATSEELADALTNHLEETEGQITRLEEIFASIDEKAVAKKCPAMEGLIKEAEEIMAEAEPGAMCDAGIIAAGQKVEHYEIATYGTLRAFAEILGLEEAAGLLQETLDQEKAADDKLTEVTPSVIMLAVAEEEER